MNSKTNSIEERVKLPPTDTISRCYQPQQGNRKVIRILTVVVYVLCVSLAAIMLSLYYIFIWDPTVRPFMTKTAQCEKLIIPEKIAIRLLNSSEVTAEQFYKHILEQYRILYQLQQQRQQFLAKQHLQLQQLAAGNRFQDIFATATIIQAPPNERPLKPITPTNGTFLLQSPIGDQPFQQLPLKLNMSTTNQFSLLDMPQNGNKLHGRRKLHRKHSSSYYNNNNNNNSNITINMTNNHRQHRRNSHKSHNSRPYNKMSLNNENTEVNIYSNLNTNKHYNNNNNNNYHVDDDFLRPALNEPILVEDTAATIVLPESFTPMPIPLILSSSEDKVQSYSERRAIAIAGGSSNNNSNVKRRTTTPTYLNPLLTGELIFKK